MPKGIYDRTNQKKAVADFNRRTKTGVPLSEEHRKNLSIAGTGQIRGPFTEEHKKRISVGKRLHSKKCNGGCGSSWCGIRKYSETSIHTELFEFLVNAGYCVTKEKQVGRKRIDCYIPELKIGFEADGTYWHSFSDRIEADKVRDAEILEKFGIIVVRLSEETIKSWKL